MKWITLIAFLSLPPTLLFSETNYVRNGSFEKADLTSPENWQLIDREEGTYLIDTTCSRSGAASFKMVPLVKNKPDHRKNEGIFTCQQNFPGPLKEGTFKFRAWVRISEDYNGKLPWVSVNVYGAGVNKYFKKAAKTKKDEWQEISIDEELWNGVERVYIQLKLTGRKGQVWWDDIAFTPGTLGEH